MLGTLIVISGVSGAGKTTIVEKSIARSGIGARIITCTTRAPRQGEVPNKDYRFLSNEDFEQKLALGAFAEHASVYGRFYGTLRADIDAVREKCAFAFLITDVQGAETIMEAYPEAHSVYIAIPRKDFVRRLTGRGETPENIILRMAYFDNECVRGSCFHKVIYNKDGRLAVSVRDFLRHINRCRARDETIASFLPNTNS